MSLKHGTPKTRTFLIAGSLLFAMTLSAETAAETRKPAFSVSVGTQFIQSKYQLTDEPFVLEAAKAVLEMGGDTLKTDLSRWYPDSLRMEARDDIQNCLDLVQKEPAILQAMDLPFRNIMVWVKAFADTYTVFDTGEFPEGEEEKIYQEIYDLTAFLLRHFSGSGKSIFIGNWEGDWHLIKAYDYEVDAKPEAIEGAIKWFRLREKAVADARRETPHENVDLYFYIELNIIQKSIKEDRPTIVNKVLPHIKTDYVSWSTYDTTQRAGELGGEAGRKMVHDALDYIEAHLPPSDIPGKRVFIGEYGFKHEWVQDPEIQAKYTAEVMQWGLEWGCPFVLYWQLYCNELRSDNRALRGFWLIDDKGTKLPVYDLHYNFLKKANAFVSEYEKKHGKLPPQSLFNKQAVQWIERRDDVDPAPPLFGPNPDMRKDR